MAGHALDGCLDHLMTSGAAHEIRPHRIEIVNRGLQEQDLGAGRAQTLGLASQPLPRCLTYSECDPLAERSRSVDVQRGHRVRATIVDRGTRPRAHRGWTPSSRLRRRTGARRCPLPGRSLESRRRPPPRRAVPHSGRLCARTHTLPGLVVDRHRPVVRVGAHDPSQARRMVSLSGSVDIRPSGSQPARIAAGEYL